MWWSFLGQSVGPQIFRTGKTGATFFICSAGKLREQVHDLLDIFSHASMGCWVAFAGHVFVTSYSYKCTLAWDDGLYLLDVFSFKIEVICLKFFM